MFRLREICKAGWLQQKVEKKNGSSIRAKKSIFLPEKWYVLCVHDDRSPFLEVYANDESVVRHEPLETFSLSECQYITTVIEDDRTFVIAFQNDGRNSMELAALSSLERREWMEMLRYKLTRLGCMESGSNIYTPFPTISAATSAAASTAIETRLSENSSPVNNATSTPPPVSSAASDGLREQEEQESEITPSGRENAASEGIIIGIDGTAGTTEQVDAMAPPVSHAHNQGGGICIYEPITRAPLRSVNGDSPPPPVESDTTNADVDNGALSSSVTGVATTEVSLSSSSPQPPVSNAAVSYAVINKEERPVLPPRNGVLAGNGGSCRSGATSMLFSEFTHRRWPSSISGCDSDRGAEESASTSTATIPNTTTTTTTYDVPRALLAPSFVVMSPPPSPPKPCFGGGSLCMASAIRTNSNVERYDPLPLVVDNRDDNSHRRRSIEENHAADDQSDAPSNEETFSSTLRSSSFSFDNPVFAQEDDGEYKARDYANGPLRRSPPAHAEELDRRGPYSALPARTTMVPWSKLKNNNYRSPARGANTDDDHRESMNRLLYSSGGITTIAAASTIRDRSRSATSSVDDDSMVPLPPVLPPPPSPPLSPPPAPPLPLPNTLTMPIGGGRVVTPMKETEAERLRSEMDSALLVKVQLLVQHVVNENGQMMGLAMVDLIGFVWIAGWLKRLTKQFSAALHIGDRLDSIVDADGKATAISSTAQVENVLNSCWRRRCHQVSFFVKRLPMAEVFVLKRAPNVDNVGIVLKRGKNEIIGIEEGNAANQAGMKAQCKAALNDVNGALVNYFITEVNGRPLNLFARHHEAQKRLCAVGTEITVLIQPSDFVKQLRKKLKQKKGYKDYIVG